MKIVDARVRLRTERLLKDWTIEIKPYFKDYIELYKMKTRLTPIPVEEFIILVKKSGIEKMIVSGRNREENEHIKEIAGSFNEIIPVGGVDICDGILSALKEIKRCCDEEYAAIYLSPFISKLDADHKSFYAIYGLCELLQKPIIIHGSIHFWRGAYMWHGSPQCIDRIAVDFPELKIIVSHGGNGFGPPILAVTQRHPNIYLEFSALRPKYMAPEFIQAANTYLKKRCLFGTDYPLVEFEEAINLWKYAIREEVWQSFFYQNALEALYDDPIPF
ncbi:MAG: amidohydrolase family protein [Promethearchaeota archaeon]